MVLLVDDESILKELAYNLTQTGFALKWVNNMYDAVHYIQEEPGHEAFEAVILDMQMEEDGLPIDAVDTAQEIYTGWAFYQHVLKNSPELQKKTIFLSGYTEELKKTISQEEYNRLSIFAKSDVNHFEKIVNTLRGWGIEPIAKDSADH